jgi:lysophospholipase L1-like esterase
VQQAENHNIPTLNTLPALSVLEQANGRGFLKLDGHLTPEGHQVIADALYDWLIANGWIASP